MAFTLEGSNNKGTPSATKEIIVGDDAKNLMSDRGVLQIIRTGRVVA